MRTDHRRRRELLRTLQRSALASPCQCVDGRIGRSLDGESLEIEPAFEHRPAAIRHIAGDPLPAQSFCRHRSGSAPGEDVEHRVARSAACTDELLVESDRFLGGVSGVLAIADIEVRKSARIEYQTLRKVALIGFGVAFQTGPPTAGGMVYQPCTIQSIQPVVHPRDAEISGDEMGIDVFSISSVSWHRPVSAHLRDVITAPGPARLARTYFRASKVRVTKPTAFILLRIGRLDLRIRPRGC